MLGLEPFASTKLAHSSKVSNVCARLYVRARARVRVRVRACARACVCTRFDVSSCELDSGLTLVDASSGQPAGASNEFHHQ